MARKPVANWMFSRLSFLDLSHLFKVFSCHTSPAWTEASPSYETLTAHRLKGRHLLLAQADRAALLWAAVFAIIAACCSEYHPNLNNQYLKWLKLFLWESESLQKTSHGPFWMPQFYNPFRFGSQMLFLFKHWLGRSFGFDPAGLILHTWLVGTSWLWWWYYTAGIMSLNKSVILFFGNL